MKSRLLVVVLAILAFCTPSARAKEIELSAKVTGKGPAMIFIPGLACAGEVWDDAVKHFSTNHECHVFTLPGFAGQAPAKEEGPYLEAVRKGIAEYIRAKKLEKPAIVGHSIGGFLALSLGTAEPDLVGPIVSFDGLPCLMALTGAKLDKATLKPNAEQMGKMFAAMPREAFLAQQKSMISMWITDPKRRETVVKWGEASDQATVAKAISELFGTDLRDDIASIKTPVLLLAPFDSDVAKYTKLTREQLTKRYEDQVTKAPHAKVAVADNSKHFIMFDAPDWAWKQMDEFLTGK